MAYGLKYQSIFHNVFGTEVQVLIYKQDYVGSVINVRTQEVTIEVNYQDENTCVVGTGAKVVIRSDPDNFSQYEDLLTSLERQFQCIIDYGSEGVVFVGYSLCDLNERQFLPYSAITLQFTDYLRRLESIYLPSLAASGNSSLLIDLIAEALDVVQGGEEPTLLVNSTLFESRMNQGPTDDFLQQTYLDNSMFHDGPSEYANGYDSLNKAFLTFGAHLYSYGSRWVFERQEDILRDGDWLRYMGIGSMPDPGSYTSQKQVLNKQDSSGGFEYVETSQIIAYESGLKTLELDLQDKQLDSFVFNDYTIENMIAVSDTTPEPGTLDYRTWYRHDDVDPVSNGYAFRDMASYIKWHYDATLSYADKQWKGLYYAFQMQFPPAPEEPVVLSVSFKQSVGEGLVPVGAKAWLKFCIRIDGGPRDGQYLTNENGTMALWPADTAIGAVVNNVLIDIPQGTKPVFSANMEFNLTDNLDMMTAPAVIELTNVWEELGSPDKQKFMIFFYPMEYIWENYDVWGQDQSRFAISDNQYLGDIQINLTGQKIPNKLTYYINADFEKTENVDVDFFDLNNLNFANGPMLANDSDGEIIKTVDWISGKVASPVELQDIFAMNKFRIYSRTIHRLKGTIRYDGYIKPFAILTDDNAQVNSENIQFILHNYTWDLNNGLYEVDAQEYSDEVVTLDQMANSEEYEGDPGVAPPTPTNLDAIQNTPGEGFDISWDAAEGATSYILQRLPYYDVFGTWVNDWKTVYEGPLTSTYDPMQLEAVPDNGMSLFYRVLAKTTLKNSAYSTALHVFWAAY